MADSDAPVGLLLRAAVASELSNVVYDMNKVRSNVSLSITVPFSPLGVTSLEALLIYCTSKSEHVQYGIWQVQHIGLVVAFRGSSTIRDYFVDAFFTPKQLPRTEWSVHGYILAKVQHKAVHERIWRQYRKWLKHKHIAGAALTLTGTCQSDSCPLLAACAHPCAAEGHSLGGGYALCLALKYMADTDRDFQDPQLRIITFGAPLILAGSQAIVEVLPHDQRQVLAVTC